MMSSKVDGRETQMAKVTVTALVDESIKEDLRLLAEVERRSISQMVSILIEDAIIAARKDGTLPSQEVDRHE